MISDQALKKANILIIVVLVVYLASMLIYPWFDGGFSWDYVHSVWYTWQALNVGVLAFASSLIAFNISAYNAEKKRGRDFLAERALLPQALSDLCMYLERSAPLLLEAYGRASRANEGPLESELPMLPMTFVPVFQSCIRTAEPKVGDSLAIILSELQVHSSRLESVHKSFSTSSPNIHSKNTYKSFLYSLAVIRARVNNLFDFARGEGTFEGNALTAGQVLSMYKALDIYPELVDDLEGFTIRSLS
ncbi:hypothetical protein [Vibrio atypicus]|uniref:hypothetical protein n=1 Tax=Vibrio atypicus TaxID=558271 RepID=UPI001357BAC7|nr:hypothetical protein [Vibrio atypicus]